MVLLEGNKGMGNERLKFNVTVYYTNIDIV